MHCDDKRTVFALKESIQKTWEELKKSEFNDKNLVKQLNELISDYQEYKKPTS